MAEQRYVTANRFALDHGLSLDQVQRLCRDGRIIGARKHPLTKRWLIFAPAKLALSAGRL